MTQRSIGAAAFLASLTLIGCITTEETATVEADLGASKFFAKPDGIPGKYIVLMRDVPTTRAALDASVDRLASRHGARIDRRYTSAVRGFAAQMPEHAARALAAEPDVLLVEQDSIMHASATQPNATQGLDRIDQRALPLDGNFTFANEGAGVTVFVIDTGLRTTHIEFTGRVNMQLAGTAIDDGNGVEDCNGHGTHVAGTVAGTILGVAKKATIVPIRVLDCQGSGPTSGIVAGIDYVAANHPARSIANLSLGGGASDAIDASIRNLVASGVTTVVAAGNENQNACNVSPAREPLALTVGSTTVTDARSSFSNFGTCVDLFAPGSDITSAWFTADNAANTISGTSMASPHVAGVAALFLAQNPTATPAQVVAAILGSATPSKISDVAGSPNLLLHSNVSAAPPTMGTSKITTPANGATVASMFDVIVDAPNATSVVLAVDGQTLVTDTVAPFAFTVSNAPAGTHVVKITATFAGGNTTTDTITVNVAGNGGGGIDPGTTPPPPAAMDDEGGGCSTSGGSAGILVVILLALVPRRRKR